MEGEESRVKKVKIGAVMKDVKIDPKKHNIIQRFSKILLLFSVIMMPYLSKSEGTKEIQPKSTDFGYIILDPLWSQFGLYNSPTTSRIHISICNVGEKIHYGFNQPQGDVKYRLVDPNGNIVVSQSSVPTSGAGYITTYNRAVAGPQALVGGSGYSQLTYVSTMTGDYYIEFLLPKGNPRRVFNYFDITVGSSANKAILGRVWCQAWMFSTGDYGRPYNGSAYIYADDGIVTSINFNGMDPYVFVLNANQTGTGNTGNAATDRQSRQGDVEYPKYKVFLNNPDESCYPTGTFGQLTSPTTITGCPPSNFCLNVFVNRPGRAEVLLDLNGVPGFQSGTADRIVSQEVTPPTTCLPWDGKDGLGNPVLTSVLLQTTLNFYNGLTHIPLYDVERNPNGYIVNLVRPSGPTPKLYWDDSKIPAAGGSTNLNGCSSPCHTWDWKCCGNNSGTDYGNTNTVNTWWYADSTKSVTTIAVPPTILVDAETRNSQGKSNDTTVCGNLTSYTLSAKVVSATGGIWTSSGTGTFTPNNTDLKGTYNISAADRTKGKVTLYLTSTGNGPCPAVTDSIVLRFQKVPTANAGSDVPACSNNATVTLSGSVTNATGGIWTSAGSGTFSPSTTSLNAIYTLSAADISAKSVTLTLTTTGNGNCTPATDQVIISVQDAPTVNAGTNQTVCSGAPSFTLAGSATNATTVTWSGGAGTFSPNANTLNATYTPTKAEIKSGVLNFTLTGSKAGCASVQSNVTYNFSKNPKAKAGSDQSVCTNTSSVTLSGSATNSTSYSWTGGTGTFTPNNTSLNVNYIPSTADKSSGSVTLTLTATATNCPSDDDKLQINFTSAPTINAGTDGTVCANNANYTLNGSVSGAGGATWSGGNGNFTPNASTLNAVYTPTASEITTGVIALVLTSNGNGLCSATKDTMLIFITPAPSVNAGPDKTLCGNNATVTLAGSTTAASSFVWSGGTGSFTPNTSTLKATYAPSASEIATGNVTLTLTASRSTCSPVTDQVVFTFTPEPTVNAGNDATVCINNATVNLGGSVTGATGATWSGGAGTFTPNATTLNATYTPTASEKSSGSVTLTLTSTGNGTCKAVTDDMVITFTPAPTVNAGTDQTVCSNNATSTLAGSITIATGGTWSGGNGTFTPSSSVLNPTYVPTNAEISSGSVTLTLTTTGNGNCNPVSDQVTINFSPAPTANAGADLSICKDNPVASLSASETVATGGTWSGGAGTFSPSNNTNNPSYTPTLAEINAGNVTLTFTTTGNGNCNPVSDQVTVSISNAPTIDAGADQTICASTSSINLNGTVTLATGIQWSTSGTGSFSPNATAPNATYVPSATDKSKGTVTLTITSTGNGSCQAVSDQMVINFTGVPSVNAGSDQIVCSNNLPIQLNGSGSTAKWTGGSGIFSDVNTFNSTYTPSSAEIAAGTVTLTLTSIPSGACPSVSDNVTITIPPAPVANAGADQTICGNSTSVNLNGSVTNAAGGFWKTSGTGSFTPNANALNASYHPSSQDVTNGTVTLTLATVGNGSCSGSSDDIIVTIQAPVAVDAGPDQSICADKSGFALSGSVTNASAATWSSSGSGSFNPDNISLNATYVPSAADKTAGTVTLTLTTNANGSCPIFSDQVVYTISPAPSINAGPDQTVCGDLFGINLAGSVTVATGGQWATSGTGTFSPDPSTLNAIYVPSAADKASGSIMLTLVSTGNGICNAVTDQMNIIVTSKPSVNAGSDQTVCADIGSVSLNGLVNVATGGIWTSSGDGSFANANDLATTYTPGTKDISSGSVSLTLTSTGNGTCNPVSDQVIITITPAPTVDAGLDRTICANNASTSLIGVLTVATGGTWSGGSGTFFQNANSLSTTYSPSAAEITAGTVTLTLTTTGNGSCKPAIDNLVISISPSPTINAGPDLSICSDSLGVPMTGSFTVANGGIWSTNGTGNFYPNTIDPNATYVPSATDKTIGSVNITYTSTGNGNCKAVSDQLSLMITPAPTVDAGQDQIVCANNGTISLNGKVTVATQGKWTTSGSGSFADANALTTTYTPSALDISTGSVNLTLSSVDNGTCKPVTNQVKVTITPAPTVDAGPDKTVCANFADVKLNGSFTTASGIKWTTSGNGIFNPDATTNNATYTPSPSDIAAGNVTLTLTTTGNGLCNAVADQLNIAITPAPTVDAGSDQTICADGTASLNGTITVATGASWKTSGTGFFTPNASALNASYVPSSADTTAHSVSLVLTTSGNGTCKPVSDSAFVTIKPTPIVYAGKDDSICGDQEFVQLSGSIANASGGLWSSSGSGLLSPDGTTLNAKYFLSGSEVQGGSITLTLTSTGNGTCKPVSDTKIIKVNPIPTANAGADQTVCANNANITLNGSVTNAAGAVWFSTGDGTFANSTQLNTVYTPSPSDIAAGSVVLTLETSGAGACNPSSDQVIVTITPAPTVDAGDDQTICANNNIVNLNGSVTIASGGTWSSSGSGTFSPSVTSLTTSYNPSAADVAAGSVSLTLTSTGNGNCAVVNDVIQFTITPAPVANPGPTINTCVNTSGIVLNGSVTGATGGTWATASGTGTFIPDANTLNATFIPSPIQKMNGRANLTLTTTGNGNCLPVSANLVINLQALPSVNAGPDVKVCTGTPTINLNGSLANTTGAVWSTSGSGSFNPSATALNATYVPSATDNIDGNTITITLTSTVNGNCAASADDLTITFQTVPVNAGTDQTVCSNSLPVQLNGSGNGTWTGGAGTFSDPNSLNTSYIPAPSEIPGTVTLTLTGNAVGTCIPGNDQVTIIFINGPAADAGADQSICANNATITVNGTESVATGGVWTTEGTGSFSNANSLSSTYTASPADIATGAVKLAFTTTGNGTCNAATDTLVLSFTPAPTVNAGPDVASCANSGPVMLNGSVTLATGGTWSIVSGTGVISNTSDLSTQYTPSASDISSGSVVLRLTSTSFGTCNAVTDDIQISLGNAPTANAGTDQIICADASSVALNGNVTIASGGQWTSTGTGTFGSSNALNTTYIPSAADTAAKSVTLTLTTTGNGNCLAASDQVIISITPVPTLDAGTDLTVCADNNVVNLSGKVSIASGGTWTTAGSGSFGNPAALTTTYSPSAADIQAGSVTLSLTTTGNGTCKAYSDQLTLFITPVPIVDAGADQSLCKDVNSISISGHVTAATGGTWSSSGTGTFASNAALQTSYAPSASDKSAGSVTLTLTSTGSGTCNAVNDVLTISFTPAPTVNAGSDRTTCTDKDTIKLGATYTVATGVTWSTSGTGTFSPSASDPNAIYYMSANDKATGTVIISATTSDNGTCNAVADDLNINIAPAPVVNAGGDITICAGQSNAVLNGTVANATGGTWTTTGTGSFGNANSITTTYIPSVSDITNGGIILTLTSTGNGSCNATADNVIVNIIPSPSASINAGLDQTVCADIKQIALNGVVSNAGGGTWSSTGGGTFSPDAITLNATYMPSATEMASGSVKLTLTTTDNGQCSAETDDMLITFTPAPTVDAGIDQSICGEPGAKVNLTGKVTVANGGIWSGGSGFFAPDPITLSNVYYPSATDISLGKVTLTLTSTGNGTCNPVSDQVLIKIQKFPTVNAGPDITVCSDINLVPLNGIVTNASGGTWTSSGTGGFTNANKLSTSYNPSKADTAASVIVLTLTTTGGCTSISDQVKVTFTPKPIIKAGANQQVCESAASVTLEGISTNATGINWSTTGTGQFTTTTGLTTTYLISSKDKTKGNITFTLSSIALGGCNSVSDKTIVVIQPEPKVKIQSADMCDPIKKGVQLNGNVSNASGLNWNSSGNGFFTPHKAHPTPKYHPSKSDISTGDVTITLTSTGTASCKPIADSTHLKFGAPILSANAGQDQEVCKGSTTTLSTPLKPNTNYSWETTKGIEVSNNSNVQVTISKDSTFVLTITDARGCTATDSVNVRIYQLPEFNMSPDYCLSNSLIVNSNPAPQPTVPGTYQWYWNGQSKNGNNTPVISPTDKGNYTIVFSYNNCTSSGSTTVNAPPKLTGGFVKACENTSTPITVKSASTSVTYSWSTGQTGQDLTTINIPVKPDTSYYTATVTDAKGCSSKDSVRVIGIKPPSLQISDTKACEGQTITLHGKPSNIANLDSLYPTYTWTKNNSFAGNTDSLLVKSAGTYKLTFAIDKCIAKDSAIVTFNPNPNISLPGYGKFCKGTDHMMVADAGKVSGYTYLWHAPSNVTLDSNNTNSITVRVPGVYSVEVTNSFNCKTKDSIMIEDICPPQVFVPNGFTPTKPGPDQTFKAFGIYYTNFKMMVFNRWGEVIFISHDKKEGWDGTYRGELMPEGVYPWVVTYEGEDSENKGPFKQEGSVTLIR